VRSKLFCGVVLCAALGLSGGTAAQALDKKKIPFMPGLDLDP
jgi:hypothetical protein